jgi:alpha-galactosidase
MKIAFIGAGSLGFSRRLMIDILGFPEFRDATFALMDINSKRLDYTRRIAEKILKQGKFPAKIQVTTNRKEALKDADYVIIMILAGDIEVIRPDVDIPLKYGVDQCIADTLGPGGVFRALRTIPVIVDICKDMEEVCPNAWLLNYTNPMAMLCWAINDATKVKNVGLCHSVQGTAWQLSNYIGVPTNEIDYWVAGINHQAWFLEFKWKGKDAYPLLREKINDPKVYNIETTRFEMFKHLGYFVTESSGHNSEYNAWFRKRPDLKEKYTPGGGWNGGTGFILQLYGSDRVNFEADLEKIASSDEPIDLTQSHEYGSYILHSLYTGTVRRINGNVKNDGLITNLPESSCVEVPCYVDKQGIHPCYVGALPPQLAALNRSNIAVQEMAVKAALTGDRDMAFWAIAYDPLTAAVCSLEEIHNMVDEMFEAEKPWLPQFKSK